MSSEIAIAVENLSKRYEIFSQPQDRLKQMVLPRIQRIFGRKPSQYFQEFWAVKNVSFSLERGSTVGIVGRNGSGKSTLLQMICGTLNPSLGSIEVNGRVAALLELGSGFNPEFTGRENVFLNASLYGLSRDQTEARFKDIEKFADIGEFIEQPVKMYSSGMVVRLAFAVIAHVDADILVVDEALSVGDAIFTQKCMRFIRAFQEKGTLLFVSHDAAAVQNLCSSAIWMSNGEIIKAGGSKEVSEAYLQYTMQETYGEEEKLSALNSEAQSQTVKKEKICVVPKEEKTPDSDQPYSSTLLVQNNLNEANGWTTGKAKIVDLEILNQDGERNPVLKGGETVTLRMKAEVYEDFSKPILGFIVKDRLGQELFGENTLPFTKAKSVLASKGKIVEGVFQFVIPMLPDGQYSVMASFANGDLQNHVQHHWLHDALIVTVSSSKVRYGLVGVNFEKVELKELV